MNYVLYARQYTNSELDAIASAFGVLLSSNMYNKDALFFEKTDDGRILTTHGPWNHANLMLKSASYARIDPTIETKIVVNLNLPEPAIERNGYVYVLDRKMI